MKLALKTCFRTACGLALLAGLSACAVPTAPGADPNPRLPTEQFKPQVAEEPHEVSLAIHAYGLSANQEAALTSLANDWHAGAGTPIQIHAPNGADPAASRRFGEGVREHLVRNGVPDGAIRIVGSNDEGVMRVGYLRRVAVTPDCAAAWSDLRRSAMNKVPSNFGCAVSANMSVQIADPSDLLGPRPSEPADAGRRGLVTDRYRQGQKTGGAVDTNASGAVSNAVN